MGTACIVHDEYGKNFTCSRFSSHILPFGPPRQNLHILVFRGVIAPRALPLLFGKGPLYARGCISEERDIRSTDLIPSIVGTGLPVTSNWFCVNPSR